MNDKNYDDYRKLWEYVVKEHVVMSFPINLDIELTNRCNRKCPECPYHSKDAPFPQEIKDMEWSLYKKLIDEGHYYGVAAVKLNYAGEPLLYPFIIEAIQYAKQNGVLDVLINTNGDFLTIDMARSLIHAGLDVITISDYGDPKQRENVARLHVLRDTKKKPKIIIKTDNPEAYQDICDVIVKPVYYDYHHLTPNHARSDFECDQPWRRFLVLADGTVLKCSCGMVVPDKIIGNAYHSKIQDLWMSDVMDYLRYCHEHHRTELVGACSQCPVRGVYISKQEEIGQKMRLVVVRE